ncbi:MAG: hypothetical protein NT099_02480 [Candidatus Saganbacteria bacterium]|nr:hypothetical protein [Candidatus Saganbacteria bacterium]
MLELVSNVKQFASKQEWEYAWHVYGKALGKRNTPAPAKQCDRVEGDFPSWEKGWIQQGITVMAHLANGMDPPEASYLAWLATSKSVFSQLPIAVSVDFSPTPRALRAILASATDPAASEICYAKFMAGLSGIQRRYPRALMVMTDSSVQPHNWDRYPRKPEELLNGIAYPFAGVALAKTDFLSPKDGATPTHEMFHLLGFAGHHGNYAVPGYPEEECVMQRYPKTTHLCRRDGDALRAFWGGVEETTGRRFLL